MDAIDSILNVRPDIKLVVADGKSTDSIREALHVHHNLSLEAYEFKTYPERMSQWTIFNDIYNANKDADYFIYSSSDIIWQMDWVSEAVKEFERNPKLQILFPCVNTGDPNLPCQIASGPRDIDPLLPPYQDAAKAPVLNAYAMIFRMDFLHTYGGYPDIYKNCFTESFLSLMCDTMGGEMRIMPRGHCFHWGEGDKWSEVGGSPYNYTEERMLFQGIMNKVQMAKAMRMVNVKFLKENLYRS
jgi:hypothetical protein